jgi:hypothetical protein
MKFALKPWFTLFLEGISTKAVFSSRRRILVFQSYTIDYFFFLRPLAAVAIAALTV